MAGALKFALVPEGVLGTNRTDFRQERGLLHCRRLAKLQLQPCDVSSGHRTSIRPARRNYSNRSHDFEQRADALRRPPRPLRRSSAAFRSTSLAKDRLPWAVSRCAHRPPILMSFRVVVVLGLFIGHTVALAETASEPPASIEQVVITGNASVAERLNGVGISTDIDAETLRLVGQTHIYTKRWVRVPGVWVSEGSEEEHLTAIRSPVFTGTGAPATSGACPLRWLVTLFGKTYARWCTS